MQRPWCVGLTGGVGCGKSTVASLFAALGADIVDTDAIARELTAAGGLALPAIARTFGADVLLASGELDRAALRARVFADANARARLEAILHPLIRQHAANRLQAGHGPYQVLVVPLLAEHIEHYRGMLDRVLVVDCDEADQLRRVAERPGLDASQAAAIMAVQAGRQARLSIADDVIDNRGQDAVHAGSAGEDVFPALHRRVRALHADYLKLALRSGACGPE